MNSSTQCNTSFLFSSQNAKNLKYLGERNYNDGTKYESLGLIPTQVSQIPQDFFDKPRKIQMSQYKWSKEETQVGSSEKKSTQCSTATTNENLNFTNFDTNKEVLPQLTHFTEKLDYTPNNFPMKWALTQDFYSPMHVDNSLSQKMQIDKSGTEFNSQFMTNTNFISLSSNSSTSQNFCIGPKKNKFNKKSQKSTQYSQNDSSFFYSQNEVSSQVLIDTKYSSKFFFIREEKIDDIGRDLERKRSYDEYENELTESAIFTVMATQQCGKWNVHYGNLLLKSRPDQDKNYCAIFHDTIKHSGLPIINHTYEIELSKSRLKFEPTQRSFECFLI